MECGGILGLPLVQWLREHSDADLVGSDQDHDRVDDLLLVPGFSYYALDREREPDVLERLVKASDVVIDLTPVEQRTGRAGGPPDFQDQLDLGAALVRACIAADVRLVHVSSAEIYGAAPEGIGTSGDAPDAWPPIREEEAVLIEDGLDAVRNAQQDSERMIQQLIHAYGTSTDLDYAIVRVFTILGKRLEALPADGLRSLFSEVREALTGGDGRTIEVTSGQHVIQTYVYVEDVVECVGRIVMDTEGRCAREIINVGNPDNRSCAVEMVREVIHRYQQRHGLPPGRMPVLIDEGHEADRWTRPPSIEKARDLIGWTPQWSLSTAIDRALDGLPPPSP